MGIEVNPNKVDDLNSSWPASNEPAKEGFAHLQNLKRAVKARANALGQYGVTTLENDTTSQAEDRAATPKLVYDATEGVAGALQDALDQIDAALLQLEGIDTSVGENGVPSNGLWLAVAGDHICYELRKPPYEPELAGNNMVQTSEDEDNFPFDTWVSVAGFTCINGGQIRLSRRLARRVDDTTDGILTRILVNGSVVQFTTQDTRASMQTQFGGNWWGVSTWVDNLTVQPGDRIEYQIQAAGMSGLGSRKAFEVVWFRVMTTKAAPAVINPSFYDKGMGYKIVGTPIQVNP